MIDRPHVREALRSIKRYADYEAFFGELASPEWLEPLANEGMFQDPPDPSSDGKYVSFPIWPESRYLARMANLAPEVVLGIALAIPKTDNVRIHEDLVEAARLMPPEVGVKVAPSILQWLESPYLLILPEKVGQLIAHFARSGQIPTALRLLRALLAVGPDQRSTPVEGESSYSASPMPRPRFHEWEYQRILTEYVPVVASAAPRELLDVLSDVLAAAMRISKPTPNDWEDYSYVWRTAIEEHELSEDHEIRGYLVSAVRDAAMALVAKQPDLLTVTLETLEGRGWKIFQRLSLHLLAEHAGEHRDQLRERLFNQTLQEDVGVFHEFWRLARIGLPFLTDPDRTLFLQFLDAQFNAQVERAGKEETIEQQDDGRRIARAWLYRRLSILGDALPPEWQQRLSAMQLELGQFEHPDLLSYTTGVTWVGPTSPRSAEDLAKLTVDEIVSYLRNWTATGKRQDSSPEGLGRELSKAVHEAPEKFAKEAHKFEGLDPTYVRNLLQGLHEAQKSKKPFPWTQVLSLGLWVIRQPREIPSRSNDRYGDADPGWGWTRKAIAAVIAAGCDEGPGMIPVDQRASVWAILQPLSEDPDPTPEHEATYGGPNMDPFTLSINTTRGEALHAVFHYALWVRRQSERETGDGGPVRGGFSTMPEVKEVLNTHLDVTQDPSLAVRSIYGRWIAWIILLDVEWARVSVPRIFPPDSEDVPLWASAWNAYLFFGGTFDNVLEVLTSEYARAIDRIGQGGGKRVGIAGNPDNRLAEHLLVFYWRGRLLFDEVNGLLATFFEAASPELKGHALDFVGRSIQNDSAGPLPDPVRVRLQALWDWRYQVNMESKDGQSELTHFGRWFASRKFPSEWALKQLLGVLRATQRIEASHLVMSALEEMVTEWPEEVAEALMLLVTGTGDRWGVPLWHEHIQTMIPALLESGNSEARQKTINAVNILGAKGHGEYERFLPEGTS